MEPLHDSRASLATSPVISQPNKVIVLTKPMDHNLTENQGWHVPQAKEVRRLKPGKIIEYLTQLHGHNEVIVIFIMRAI